MSAVSNALGGTMAPVVRADCRIPGHLWHWPLVGLGKVIDWDIESVVGRLAWSGVALVAAVLTYRFVEQPARKRSALATSVREQ